MGRLTFEPLGAGDSHSGLGCINAVLTLLSPFVFLSSHDLVTLNGVYPAAVNFNRWDSGENDIDTLHNAAELLTLFWINPTH